MGTRINVLFPHQMVEWADRYSTIQLLNNSLLAARDVNRYWNEEDVNLENTWIAEPPFPPPETRDYIRYTGPGPLFVSVNPFSVHVRTGGRWRGFLSIQQLRSVHIGAFRSIANAFSAPIMRIFPDDDFVTGEFWEGGDFAACSDILNQRYADPVSLEDQIDSRIASETDTGCPVIQYVCTLQ